MVRQYDKCGQVFIQGPERITDPASRAGKAGQHKASGLQQRGLRVHTTFADEIVDEGHVVHMRAKRGHGITQHFAGLTVGLKVPRGFHPWAETILKCLHFLAEITGLAVILDEVRLVIPQIKMARGS